MLPQMPPTKPEPQNMVVHNVCMTLLLAILTKNALFTCYGTFTYLCRAYIHNINMRVCIISAGGHELKGG